VYQIDRSRAARDDAPADVRTVHSLTLWIGTMDSNIGSIALSLKALLLTANTRDFSVIPGLKIEDWLN